MEHLKEKIRNIPDFPSKGILFRDITTLIKEKQAFKEVIDSFAGTFGDMKIDAVVSVEARGFIFGGALAYCLGAAMVPIRKKGKLPWKTHTASYDLEYGKDTLEIHRDALAKGDRVLIVDDLLATGGTVSAAIKLVEKFDASVVGIGFLIELTDLEGREKLAGYPITSFIKYW